MKKQYNEVMARIAVGPAMRGRILANLQSVSFAVEEQPKGKTLPFPAKKYLAVAAGFAVLLLGTFAIKSILPAQKPFVQGQTGIVEVATAKELAGQVGFAVEEAENLPFAVEETVYTAYPGPMAQISYFGAGEGEFATLRKAPGEGDISGDYTVYGNVQEIVLGTATVTLKGEGELFSLALWQSGKYAYSLQVTPAMGAVEWEALLPLSPAG